MLDFICNEAVDDAFTVASYFSEADGLLATSSTSRMAMLDRYDARNLSQSLAASIAIRGVLFGNSQPSSSRSAFFPFFDKIFTCFCFSIAVMLFAHALTFWYTDGIQYAVQIYGRLSKHSSSARCYIWIILISHFAGLRPSSNASSGQGIWRSVFHALFVLLDV